MSLTYVLTDLQNTYNLSFSFASSATDKCIVNLNETFKTPDLAIRKLCESCNFDLKKLNNVFIIIETQKRIPKFIRKKTKYVYKIHISEIYTNEELGLSKIKINGAYYLADINGNFSFSSEINKLKFEVSHLAYIDKDTILEANQNSHSIKLTPFSKSLKPVEVSSVQVIEHISIGKDPGTISVNSESNGFLAGESNNAIFNTLRLQPGILSAGEQSSDYVIWNSYKGQNHLVFDGITLFKANTYNQTISGINPNIIKTIDIYKGAYNADIGDRVGGVIDIKSKTGNFNKFQTIFNVNNQLVNLYVNIPIKSKANIQASVRSTFKNPFDIKFKTLNTNYIRPETNFKDVSLKFTTLIKNKNPFRISLIINNDTYKEILKDKLDNDLAATFSNSIQGGFSLYYGKNWKSGALTDINISQSILATNFVNMFDKHNFIQTANNVTERSVKISHLLMATRTHQFKFGLNLINNKSFFKNDSSTYNFITSSESLTRLNVYFTDNWHFTPRLKINYGLKIESPIQLNTMLLQPRISVKYRPSNNISLYGSWGIYNQFMSELAIVDQYQNNLFHWSILNKKSKPNQSSHYVLGASVLKSRWKLSVEGFYKTTSNLQTFYLTDSENIDLSSGSAKTSGLDFFISKTLKKHNFWVAYTVSQSKDYFNHYSNTTWQLAPQNQLHELKTACVFNFNPIHFSINYVYGSGLTYVKSNGSRISFPYNRLDIALKYNFRIKKLKAETGFSILNVLNNRNFNFNSFTNFPELENQFVLSTTFTPLLFIKVKF